MQMQSGLFGTAPLRYAGMDWASILDAAIGSFKRSPGLLGWRGCMSKVSVKQV
jgi:hypothetical protein